MRKDYALGYVAGEQVHTQWMDRVVNLMYRDFPPVLRKYSGAGVLWRARNDLATTFLRETDADKLLMVDTDILFTPEDVDALLDHEEPVVSGVYGTTSSWSGDVTLVVDGCGFVSIGREVIEALEPRPFLPIPTAEGDLTGEDVGFRIRAQQAGFSICIDTEVRVQHVKSIILGIEDTELELEGDIAHRLEGLV